MQQIYLKLIYMKGVIIPAIFGLLLFSCRPSEPVQKSAKAPLVRVIDISREKVVFPVRASGIVVPAREIKLSFKTGGIVRSLYADEGNRVKKGMLLAELNMAEIDAQVIQARNGFEKAQRDFTRAQNLFNDSVITLEQFQNAQTASNIASAMLEAANFNSAYSRIMAPADGIILKRLVEEHEMVNPGYPVFVFGTTGAYWKIKAGLADRDYVRILPGDSANITFDAYPGEVFHATVSQVTEAANISTGTYEIELDLPAVSKKLASGFIANIEIIPSQSEAYYKIPVESVVEAEGRTGFVYKVDDSGKARKVKIEISGISGGWAAVKGDLNGSDVIATEGAAYLSDGDSVYIVK